MCHCKSFSVPIFTVMLWKNSIWSTVWSDPSACASSAVKRMSHSQRMGWIFTTGNTVLCWGAAMNANRYTNPTSSEVLAWFFSPLERLAQLSVHRLSEHRSALCSQVVEIASLTEHLLGECESRSKFSQCSRCSEAVATEDLTRHAQGPACNREFALSHCLPTGLFLRFD